jgi:aldose sugar dehydrogenase
MRWLWRSLVGLGVFCVVLALAAAWYLNGRDAREPSRMTFMAQCASCHGQDLAGNAPETTLLGTLRYGDSITALTRSIGERHNSLVVTADFGPSMRKALALYISEQRQEIPTIAGSHKRILPQGLVSTDHHDFRVERVAELSSGPYSIAPLPNGQILLSEKVRGLSIIDQQGQQSQLITGAPEVWSEIIQLRGSYIGLGMMLDVELHPQYEQNGWVYLSHSDRCQFACGSLWPVSMVRVLRGRINNGRWMDQEVVWSVHKDNYTVVPDGVAAGRLAFDKQGFIYITVGGKSTYDNLHVMDTPYGKIHRVRDDGQVPENNPFWKPISERSVSSSRQSVWSYGHRTTQGLATDPLTGYVWGTEMGPRGGDEVNRIIGGGNYGWPLYSNGLDYNAEPITIGRDLGLDFPLSATIPPIVDFTPAPSLSNFTFHHGEQFPEWDNDLLIGSLRAQTLYRIRIIDDEVVEIEKLLTKLGRIRDVEMGFDGLVYVLLEHGDGGSIVKLRPD